MTDAAKEKTAFSVPEDLFQYKVLPFGLHGTLAMFQRAMNKLLRPHREYAVAYLDDIVVFSSDWESHLPRVEGVLQSPRTHGFTANRKKCAIGLKEAKYLGYGIGRGQIKPQSSKVEAVLTWPKPKSKSQLRTFLGLVGYYRRFLKYFTTRAAPLTALRKSLQTRYSGLKRWRLLGRI